jgi:hypothetical protein
LSGSIFFILITAAGSSDEHREASFTGIRCIAVIWMGAAMVSASVSRCVKEREPLRASARALSVGEMYVSPP